MAIQVRQSKSAFISRNFREFSIILKQSLRATSSHEVISFTRDVVRIDVVLNLSCKYQRSVTFKTKITDRIFGPMIPRKKKDKDHDKKTEYVW